MRSVWDTKLLCILRTRRKFPSHFLSGPIYLIGFAIFCLPFGVLASAFIEASSVPFLFWAWDVDHIDTINAWLVNPWLGALVICCCDDPR